MGKVNIGANTFEANKQAQALTQIKGNQIIVTTAAFTSIVAATYDTNITLGAFSLPKSAFLRSVYVTGYNIVNATGLYANLGMRVQIQNIANYYVPNVNTFPFPNNRTFDIFKGEQEGSVQIEFQEKSFFVGANTTVTFLCQGFFTSQFQVSDVATATVNLEFDFE